MKSSTRWYLLLPAFVLFWPGVQSLIAFLRFGAEFFVTDTQSLWSGLIAFAALGLVSGLVAISLLKRAGSRKARIGILVGYVVAIFPAFIASLVAPLVLESLYQLHITPFVLVYILTPITSAIGGSIWLAAGSIFGYLIGGGSRKPA
jgi:hypothetical protein